jgi:hypothetical protein
MNCQANKKNKIAPSPTLSNRRSEDEVWERTKSQNLSAQLLDFCSSQCRSPHASLGLSSALLVRSAEQSARKQERQLDNWQCTTAGRTLQCPRDLASVSEAKHNEGLAVSHKAHSAGHQLVIVACRWTPDLAILCLHSRTLPRNSEKEGAKFG